MKLTNVQTLAIATAGLAIHLTLSRGFTHLVAPEHAVWDCDAEFLSRVGNAKVVVAGGSHGLMAIRPGTVPSTVIVSSLGEHYGRTRYRLEWLLNHHPGRLETVLLDFEAASFSGFRTDDFTPEYIWARYVPYLELGRERGMLLPYAQMWAKARFAPYVGEGDTIAQWVTARNNARRKTPNDPVVQRQTAEDVAARHFPTGVLVWDERQANNLRELIAMIRDRGLRVVLVTYPVHPSYLRRVQARGVDLARRDALLGDLVEPGAVDYLDYEDRFDLRNLFFDPDHLGPVGARLFSKHLTEDLVRIGVLPEAG